MTDTRIYNHQVTLKQLVSLKPYAKSIHLNSLKKSAALYAGLQSSRIRGRGMDFDEVRIYQAGDDIRNMDWRVTARSGKPHTKLYCEERERPVYFIVDLAPSMYFGSQITFKSVIAQQTAAILAWAAISTGDAVGGMITGSEQAIELKPGLGTHAVLRLLKQIQQPAKTQSTNTAANKSYKLISALKHARQRLKPGTLIFVLSDFYEFDVEMQSYLTLLNQRQDCILGFIYDKLETTLPRSEPRSGPSSGYYTVTDGNNLFQFNSHDKSLQMQYKQSFQEKLDNLQQFCVSQKIGLHSLTTDTDVVKHLSDIFRKN